MYYLDKSRRLIEGVSNNLPKGCKALADYNKKRKFRKGDIVCFRDFAPQVLSKSYGLISSNLYNGKFVIISTAPRSVTLPKDFGAHIELQPINSRQTIQAPSCALKLVKKKKILKKKKTVRKKPHVLFNEDSECVSFNTFVRVNNGEIYRTTIASSDLWEHRDVAES